MATSSKIIPVILCGGSGSRLWPISREQNPKPFIRLNDNQSLLQKAFLRASKISSEIVTITNREFFFRVNDDYQEVSDQAENIKKHFILEPFGRNTAAAITAASLYIEKYIDPDATILVLTADHLIEDVEAFLIAVKEAEKLAHQGKIVTFGITPSMAETAYGYIEHKNNDVIRFVEKPDRATAEQYLKSGNFVWNSGMFCFKAKKMEQEINKYSPEIYEKTKISVENGRVLTGNDFQQFDLLPDFFKEVPSDSIDYAVMEKTKDAAVIKCNIGWTDIGCWRSYGDLIKPDEHGNRLKGDVVIKDSSNCVVLSENRVVGAIGLNDIVIVDTDDALLVANKNSTQDVKAVFNKLKSTGHETYKLHQTVHRPWGTYTVLEEGSNFKIKRIEVKPAQQLSLQMHHHRSEHWVVVNGTAKVVNGEKEIILNVNESTFIPATHKHRLENIGNQTLVLIEVQTGSYLGEDDIVRFQDNYGRA